ncbi:CopG family transcriptional regulator [Candidatus Heimdallarchaeota archaeon B3_Heim]|nr:MAG: CopG family transcriptional regulator [Candidatus Heimdallarchaeota archaeon B3_Heim]
MTKISVEVPQHILDDLKLHIGTDKKFVSLSDAIRAALRKLLDSLDEIDNRHGRGIEAQPKLK